MEQLEVLALARLDELLALNTLKQSIDSASTPPVFVAANPSIKSNPNDDSTSSIVASVKPSTSSQHTPLLSLNSTTDQEHDSPQQSAIAMIVPEQQEQLASTSLPRIDGNTLEAMKKKLMREILASKKTEHIRVSQEKEIIETFYHIQNLTVNDRKSFERVSHRLMQRINPTFNIPPATSENPISQIVCLYREFFCSIRQNKQAQEIDRIFTNSLCNKFSFVCLLINWLIEVTRSMLKDFIQSSKPDDSRKSPVKRFIPSTTVTNTNTTQHDQSYQEDINPQQDNLCEISLNNKKNQLNCEYQQQSEVLRYLRFLNSEKKRGSAAMTNLIGNDNCNMSNSRSGYSLESNLRQSKGDRFKKRASVHMPTMNRLCQYYPNTSHQSSQAASTQYSFLHLQNQLIFMFLHQGVILPPPTSSQFPSTQSTFGQNNSQYSSHVSQLLNSADKLTLQVLQSQSINCTLVSKDFIWNTHVQLSSEYRLYGETLSDIDHTYITQNAPWIGGSSSNSNSNKQQLSRRLAALHASKEWIESNYIAVLRAQLSKNTYIKSTINAFKSTRVPQIAIDVLASPTKQFSNALFLKKNTQKKKQEFYPTALPATNNFEQQSTNSSTLKTVIEQSSQSHSTAASDLKSKLIQINCTNASGGRFASRKKHKASNLSNSVVIPLTIEQSQKTTAANSNQKTRMINSEQILSRIALERKQQQQQQQQQQHYSQQQQSSNIQQQQHLLPPASAPMSPSKTRVKSYVSQSDNHHKAQSRSSCSRQRGTTTTTTTATTTAVSSEYEEQLSYMTLAKSKQPHEMIPNAQLPNDSHMQQRPSPNIDQIEGKTDIVVQESNCEYNGNASMINRQNQVSIDHLLNQFNMIPSTDRLDSIQQEFSPGYEQQFEQNIATHSLRMPSLRSTRLVSKQLLNDILNSAPPTGGQIQTSSDDASNQQRQFALSSGFKLGIHDSNEKPSGKQVHYQLTQSVLVPATTTIDHASPEQSSQRENSRDQLRADVIKHGIRSVSAFTSVLQNTISTTAVVAAQCAPPPIDSTEYPCGPPQPSTTTTTTTIPLQQQIQLITQWKGRFKKQTDESASEYIGGVKGLSVNGQRQQQQQSQLLYHQQQQQHSFQQHRSIKSQNSFSQQQENTNPMHNNRSSGAFPPNDQCERSSSIGTADIIIPRVPSFSLRRHGSIDSTCHPIGNANQQHVTVEMANSKQYVVANAAAPTERLSILRRMQKQSQLVPTNAYIGEELSDLTTYFNANSSTQRFSSQQSHVAAAQVSRKVSKKRGYTGSANDSTVMLITGSQNLNQTSSFQAKPKGKSEKKEEQIVSLSPFQFRMINSQQQQQSQSQFHDISIHARSRLQEGQQQQQNQLNHHGIVSNHTKKSNALNRKKESELQSFQQFTYREDVSMQLPSISRRGIEEIALSSG